MRESEEFVRGKLEEFLGTELKIGEDPPDYYVKHDEKIIPLEVTQLTPITFDVDGNPINRTGQDIPRLNICDALNEEHGHLLPAERRLILRILMPTKDPHLFHKGLERELPGMIQVLGSELNVEKSISVEGVPIMFQIMRRPSRKYKAIACTVQNLMASTDLMKNASVMLRERVMAKDNSMDGFFSMGSVWLALYNRDILLDNDEYQVAYDTLNLNHRFERVYLVKSNGEILELSQ